MKKLMERWNNFELLNFICLVAMISGLILANPVWSLACCLLALVLIVVGVPAWIAIATPCVIVLGFSIHSTLWIWSKEEGYFIFYGDFE